MTQRRGLSEDNRELLLIHMNRVIENTAHEVAEQLVTGSYGGDMIYPPNCGLDAGELDAIDALCEIPHIESALRKVTADAACRPVLALLSLVDGIGDPEGEGWTGVSLLDECDNDVQGEFLNTGLFDKYWDWMRVRRSLPWKLDTT